MSEQDVSATGDSAKILLGVCGGVAAYKAIELLRLYQKHGFDVRVCMTAEAKKFVGASTFRALTRSEVLSDLFAHQDAIPHISYAEWADAAVVIPATANCMAKLAVGIADDVLSTTLLALPSYTPLLVAPAMNVHMWQAQATQENLQTLQRRGVRMVLPVSGRLACGDVGAGKLAKVEDIFAATLDVLDAQHALKSFDTDPDQTVLMSWDKATADSDGKTQFLADSARAQLSLDDDQGPSMADTSRLLEGRHVLVTAGPTHEAIDPVRYIANASSGKMGYAIATACQRLGAKVTLVSGPTTLEAPEAVRRINVVSADEMYEAALSAFETADVAVCAAAVADYKPADVADHKLKKGRDKLEAIKLVRTRDILATLSAAKGARLVVGFAAETNNLIENAQAKLASKGCDLIVANDVSRPDSAFGGDTNHVSFVGADGVEELPTLSKQHVAELLAKKIAVMLEFEDTESNDATVVRPRPKF